SDPNPTPHPHRGQLTAVDPVSDRLLVEPEDRGDVGDGQEFVGHVIQSRQQPVFAPLPRSVSRKWLLEDSALRWVMCPRSGSRPNCGQPLTRSTGRSWPILSSLA